MEQEVTMNATTDREVVQRALVQLASGTRSTADLLGVDPSVVNGLYALGLAAREKGRHNMADNLFQRCLLLAPMRGDLWIALAASRQALGRPDEAGEMYQVAALVSGETVPVAYAAACFAQDGQIGRACSLAKFVREEIEDESVVAPWLAVVDAHAETDGASCR
jgi:Flp pilus assembly protein TadD